MENTTLYYILLHQSAHCCVSGITSETRQDLHPPSRGGSAQTADFDNVTEQQHEGEFESG